MRHLGTDINYIVLENMYAYLRDKVDFYFDTPVQSVAAEEGGYRIVCEKEEYFCEKFKITPAQIFRTKMPMKLDYMFSIAGNLPV